MDSSSTCSSCILCCLSPQASVRVRGRVRVHLTAARTNLGTKQIFWFIASIQTVIRYESSLPSSPLYLTVSCGRGTVCVCVDRVWIAFVCVLCWVCRKVPLVLSMPTLMQLVQVENFILNFKILSIYNIKCYVIEIRYMFY